MSAHSLVSLGARHPIHNWEYADATARDGASGFTSADIGKVARQLDDDTFYVLNATTPVWTQIDGGGGGGSPTGIIRSQAVFAEQMGVANAAFPVTNIQPTTLDNTSAWLATSLQDDTLEQIKWWGAISPDATFFGTAANRLYLQPVIKPFSDPGAARTIGLRLYYSNVPFNAAVPSWKSIDLADFDIGANIYHQKKLYTITVGNGTGELDITAGDPLYLGLARINPTGGTELTGVSHLFMVVEGWGVV